MGLKTTITTTALNTAMDYISSAPEKDLPRLLHLIEGLGWDKAQTEVFHQILDDPENVWYHHEFVAGYRQ